MVSIEINNASDQSRDLHNMQYAMEQAFSVLELSFVNNIAFEAAPKIAGMENMLAKGAEWRETQELEALRSEIVRDIEAAAGLGVDSTVVQKLIETVRNAPSKDALQNIRSAAIAEAGVAGSRADDRIDGETKDQKVSRLWDEIDRLEQEAKGHLDGAKDKGYISKDELEQRNALEAEANKLQAYADSLPPGPEKDKANAAAATLAAQLAKEDERLFGKAKQSAEAAGDAPAVQTYDDQIDKAKTRQDKVSQLTDAFYANNNAERRTNTQSLREEMAQAPEEKQEKPTGLLAFAEASPAERYTPTPMGNAARDEGGIGRI